MPLRSFYAVLGVAADASADAIRKAYLSLALKNHPDKNNGRNTERMKEIAVAYQTLFDPEKRRKYDAEHGNRGSSSVPGFTPEPNAYSNAYSNPYSYQYSDPYSNQYSGQSSKPDFKPDYEQKEEPYRGLPENINVSLKVTLEDLLRGATKEIVVRRRVRCAYCRPGPFECRTCHGTKMATECPTLLVSIRSGMLPGVKICLSGQGHRADASGQASGHVIVELREEQHPRFQRRSKGAPNLILREPVIVTAATVRIGRPVLIRTLYGRELSVRLPASSSSKLGSIQLVAFNEGMPISVARHEERGWLLVQVEVTKDERASSSAPRGRAEDITVYLLVTPRELREGFTREIVVHKSVACRYCQYRTSGCWNCEYQKVIPELDTLRVKIPAGSNFGDRMVNVGGGNSDPSGYSSGDLTVVLQRYNHNFVVDDEDEDSDEYAYVNAEDGDETGREETNYDDGSGYTDGYVNSTGYAQFEDVVGDHERDDHDHGGREEADGSGYTDGYVNSTGYAQFEDVVDDHERDVHDHDGEEEAEKPYDYNFGHTDDYVNGSGFAQFEDVDELERDVHEDGGDEEGVNLTGSEGEYFDVEGCGEEGEDVSGEGGEEVEVHEEGGSLEDVETYEDSDSTEEVEDEEGATDYEEVEDYENGCQ